MRIDDRHLDTLRQDGFVVIENFLSDQEARAALEGFTRYFPATGQAGSWLKFPTEDSSLNHVFMHPDIIDAAERIHDDKDLLIADGMFGVRYAGEAQETIGGLGWHVDYRNNILGPEVVDRSMMARYPVFGMYLGEVGKGDAPIRMMRHGQTYDDGVDIIGPPGTLWIYTLFTHHTATPFLNPTGLRAVVSTILTPRKRLFEVARLMTQKSGSDEKSLAKVIADATPRQLELLGFPKARDRFWTPEYVAGMERRYPGFKGEQFICSVPDEAPVSA